MTMGNIIARCRKDRKLTQEALAQMLEVSNQAVSKWESDQCCPDIQLLPRLADLFEISLDELFGREPHKKPQMEPAGNLPWADDGILRAVLFQGHRLRGRDDRAREIVFTYEGSALDIQSAFSVHCQDVEGDVTAGGSVSCESVDGNVQAGGNVSCCDVDGDVTAGGTVNCACVSGDVHSGGNTNCAGVEGDVDAGGNVQCGDVSGCVDAGACVTCGDVEGDVEAGRDVHCRNVSGDIDAGNNVECGPVEGDINADGIVTIRK